MVAPFASMPACSDSTTASRSARHCARRQLPGRAQRVDAGAEQRLVGVDVAHARDAPLVEQERLDRRAAAARQRAQVLGRELGRRAARRPAGAAKNASRASSPSASSPVPKRRGSTKSSSAAPASRSNRTRVCGGRSGGSSSSVPVMRRWQEQERPRPRAARPGTCRGARAARPRGPRPRRRSRAAASGRHQRASSTSSAGERAALDVRAPGGGGWSRPRAARARRPMLGGWCLSVRRG